MMSQAVKVITKAMKAPQDPTLLIERLALTRQGEVRYCLKTPYPRFRY